MLKDIAYAMVYVLMSSLMVPAMLSILRVRYEMPGVLLAAVAGGLALLIPVIGGVASLIVHIVALDRLTSASLWPDAVISVMVSRLITVPVMVASAAFIG